MNEDYDEEKKHIDDEEWYWERLEPILINYLKTAI